MERQSVVAIEEDIFESCISNNLKEDTGKKYLEGLRNSMAARGQNDEEFSEIQNSSLVLAVKEIPKLTY